MPRGTMPLSFYIEGYLIVALTSPSYKKNGRIYKKE